MVYYMYVIIFASVWPFPVINDVILQCVIPIRYSSTRLILDMGITILFRIAS